MDKFIELLKKVFQIMDKYGSIEKADNSYTEMDNDFRKVLKQVSYEKKTVLLILEGFENTILENINNDLSFAGFIINKLSQNFEEYKDYESDDIVIDMFNSFVKEKIEAKLSNFNAKNKRNQLLEVLNNISLMKYEGKSVHGRIIFTNIETIKEYIKYKIEFKNKIAIKNIRLIRKLLETTDNSFALIGDYEYIYGIGHLTNIEKIELNTIFVVDFRGIQYYSLFEFRKKSERVESNDSSETITYKLNTVLIANMINGVPQLYVNQYSTSRLESVFSAVFGKNITKENKNKIFEIVGKAKDQKKGTMEERDIILL